MDLFCWCSARQTANKNKKLFIQNDLLLICRNNLCRSTLSPAKCCGWLLFSSSFVQSILSDPLIWKICAFLFIWKLLIFNKKNEKPHTLGYTNCIEWVHWLNWTLIVTGPRFEILCARYIVCAVALQQLVLSLSIILNVLCNCRCSFPFCSP